MKKKPPSFLVAHRYRLLKKLGEGGMGVVYLAQDSLTTQKDETEVALKFLHSAGSSSQVENFRREFEILSQLKHPHLSQVYDFGWDPNREKFFFTSQYLKGSDIFEATQDRPPEEIVPLLEQVCRVLHYIHQNGVLHNDLKPSNILVQAERVKVLDFGISTLFRSEVWNPSLGGTAGFVAPEVIQGGIPNPSTDLFALGIIFFKIFSRTMPFSGKNSQEIFSQTISKPVPKLTHFNKKLPEKLVHLVEKLTARDPRQRPGSAEQVMEFLEHLFQDKISRGVLQKQDLQLFPPVFVGRKKEMALLWRKVEQNLMHPDKTISGYVQIEGSEGVGKSRFLRNFARQLQIRDLALCHTRCVPGSPELYHPWENLFAQLINFTPAGFFPDGPPMELFQKPIADSFEDEGSWIEEPIDQQFRLFHTMGRWLKAVCEHRPVVMMIDDFHWMEGESLKFFQFLLRFCRNNRLFITALKPNPRRELHLFSNRFASETVLLKPFGKNTVEKMAASILGKKSLSSRLIENFYSASKGHPKVLEHLLQEWVRKKWLIQNGDSWELVRGFGSERGKIEGEISVQRKNFLILCSLCGSLISEEELFHLDKRDRKKIREMIQTEIEHGMLRRLDEKHYEWRDPKLATQLYDSQKKNATLRNQLEKNHLRLAQALKKDRHGKTRLNSWERATHHFLAANKKLEVYEIYFQIGKEYWERGSLHKAQEYLFHAQEGFNQLESQSQVLLQEVLVEIYFLQGHPQEALPLLEKLYGDNRLMDEKRALIGLKWATILRNRGKYREAADLLQDILGRLSEKKEAILCARLLSLLAFCQGHLKEPVEALHILRKAMSLVSMNKEPKYYALIVNFEGIIQKDFFHNEEKALHCFQKAIDILEKTSHFRERGIVLHNLARILDQRGDSEEAKRYYTESLHWARSVGDVGRIHYCLNSLGVFHSRRMKFNLAQNFFREALDLAEVLNNRTLQGRTLLSLGRLAHVQCQFEEALKYYKMAFEVIQNLPQKSSFLPDLMSWYVVFLSLGDMKGAQETLEKIKALAGPEKSSQWTGFLAFYQGWYFALKKDYSRSLAQVRKSQEIFQTEKMILLQREAQCLAIRISLWQEKNLSPEIVQELQQCLELFQEKGDRFQVFRTRLLLLSAKEKCLPFDPSDLREAIDLKEKFFEDLISLPEHSIELHMVLCAYYEKNRQPIDALSHLEAAQGQFEKILETLSPSFREGFCNTFQAQELRAFQEKFERNPDEGVQHWLRLKKEVQFKNELYLSHIQLLESSFSYQGVLDSGLKLIFSLFPVSRAALVLKRKNQYSFYRGLDRGEDRYWRISKTLQNKWAEKIQTADSQESILEKPYLALSLREDNQINGFFLLEGDKISDQNLVDLNRWRNQINRLLVREKQVETKLRELEKSTTSLSELRQTLWNFERTLVFKGSHDTFIGGRSPAMARVIQCVDRVLDSQVPLLIEGESGTGKEKLVQIIHENGPLADKPLVSISCGSFSPDILESQLFGHVKGAFTGALADQEGLLVKAHGGTLFLDEVTDLPLEIQVKFLRFLQEWEILPLGGNQTRKIKVRLITSTRQNLQEWIQKGLFREDLFNRLNVIQIHLPPLRERREDIPLFIEHFLKKYDLSQKLQFADQALKALYYAPWPGNIRQLENHLQMLCSMKLRRKITLKDLPQEIRNPKSVLPATNYEEAQDHFLRDYLKNLIQFAQGNITQAIKISGIPRTTLYRHLKRLFGVHFAEELGLN